MASPSGDNHDTPFARLIGRSRIVVVVAVVAVLLCAFSLFLLGAFLAAEAIWQAWGGVIGGEEESTEVTIRFLEIVTVMLKAVFFYLIGVGLYSLFISPLNVTVALGVETLNDLETKVISVVIVIMAVHFLERFILGADARETLQHAGALALAVGALVVFKFLAHRESLEARRQRPATMERAKHEMFEREHEEHDVDRRLEDAERPEPGRQEAPRPEARRAESERRRPRGRR
ncbi:MAG TPA: YqhA family protein [Burkholderiales bacterium]|nr:YqhA family protein [Burkholderiales bacterium]